MPRELSAVYGYKGALPPEAAVPPGVRKRPALQQKSNSFRVPARLSPPIASRSEIPAALAGLYCSPRHNLSPAPIRRRGGMPVPEFPVLPPGRMCLSFRRQYHTARRKISPLSGTGSPAEADSVLPVLYALPSFFSCSIFPSLILFLMVSRPLDMCKKTS